MSRHLTSREVVDALDETLAASRRAHLERCSWCQEQLARTEQVLKAARDADEIPEPSPLFWESLRERVRQSTESQPIPGADWRPRAWRWLAVAAPTMLAVAAVVSLGRDAPVPTPDPPAAPPVAAAPLPEEVGGTAAGGPIWSDMVQLTAELPVEQFQVVAPVRVESAHGWLDELTLDERAELLRLLKQAMEGGI